MQVRLATQVNISLHASWDFPDGWRGDPGSVGSGGWSYGNASAIAIWLWPLIPQWEKGLEEAASTLLRLRHPMVMGERKNKRRLEWKGCVRSPGRVAKNSKILHNWRPHGGYGAMERNEWRAWAGSWGRELWAIAEETFESSGGDSMRKKVTPS